MHIERASEDDWQEIAEIFIAARAGMTYLPALHSDAETRLFIRRVVKRSAVWVAERDGEILGFAALEPGWLHHLYVAPAAHNAGAGSLLLAKAKEELPQGFSLWTFQANLGARRFYERHGLAEARRTNGAENEEGLPDILYEWRP
ncbi:GNAT family N-acetyltransferase [Parvibaculum sp.]|uniref:GNAT family N-acetyltransferase n=1 Tax=Parvibaculum sp. TaxID=2024848 RepID=UPI001B0D215A|nr:GNAT family N-acetyltransferase [Parvibaculum sp.]MBO6635375.1 GNAT family N-acetyltransferase [Parvibaculum sp.]MBO6677378.1 GNAT family N-acetyltransferase [Parvibaculum sp.]MBO6684555.1 GNAT family N-acetyltransferase [Parvibaculum sp.]MBO6903981.1 GNAT family N-acetyltransferase [Parvibaculum sp.]